MTTTTRFEGKVALVTGAASGIGEATARRLAAEGAKVVFTDLDAEACGRAAAGVPGETLAIALDVSSEAAWEQAMATLLARFGRLDILVNNAGVAFGGPVVETSLADWRRVLAINLDGCFLGTREAFRAMKPGGTVVNMASASAVKAAAGASLYSASKAAIVQFTKAAALEGIAQGIRVNAVLPGGVETPMWGGMPMWQAIADAEGPEAAWAALAKPTPAGRFATAAEVAGVIAFLASDEAAMMVGAAVAMDGGISL